MAAMGAVDTEPRQESETVAGTCKLASGRVEGACRERASGAVKPIASYGRTLL